MILDTNALSAIAEGETGAVKQFAQATRAAIPVIVLGEYRFGIFQSTRRHEYEQWLVDMLSVSDLLAVDEETATCYAALRNQLKHAGTPIPSNDAWIGALCRQHGLAILSRDRHFDVIKGLRRLDW